MGNNHQLCTKVNAEQCIYRLTYTEKINNADLPHTEQQFSDTFCLLFNISGSGLLTLNDQRWRLKNLTLYTMMPGETFMLKTEPHQKHELYLFRFQMYTPQGQSIEEVSTEQARSLLNVWQFIDISSIEHIHSLLSDMTTEWQKPESISFFRSQTLFQQLILQLFTLHKEDICDTTHALFKTKQYIDQHSEEPLSLTSLSHMAGISANHYSELFKKHFDVSVTDYITKKRLARAKQFMAKGHAKLKDIAQDIGYQDPYYFSRIFKKKTGITPSAYMKSRQRKMAAYGHSILGQLTPIHIIPYAAPLHPKWTAHDFEHYAEEIPIHLSAHRINEHAEANLQQLKEAQPELIIANDHVTEEEKQVLKTICPVHFVPFTQLDWRAQFRQTALFLNETREAEEWLLHYEELVIQAKKACLIDHPPRTVLPLRIFQDQLYLSVNRTMAEVIFHDIGLLPAFQNDGQLIEKKISIHSIQQLDPDAIFLLLHKEPKTIAFYQKLKQQEAWQNLKAVTQQAVYPLASDPWREYTAASHQRVIQDLLSFFP
ncbi:MULTISPECIES: AraC family transcriptional regulator [Bacillus]|uniref:AraC family transcriptional regulator n=1 Tax=Bacillus TaxID=1386 RepID=UPI000F786285|nr:MULTISPECIES: AraC family transcriptional regulator [Bacillus]MDJ0286548.1 AraC family transcriptional regulator [Bacillus altitudinis]